MAENILQKGNEEVANLEFRAFILELIKLLDKYTKIEVIAILEEVLKL